MSAITIEEALKKYDKRLYGLKYTQENIGKCTHNINYYINETSKAIAAGQSEEHLKNITNLFLREFIYTDDKYDINTDQRIDSCIKVNGEIRVLIEAKKPSNKAEMVSKDNINVKALHEIILYYLNVTRDVTGSKVKRVPNAEIRRCLITDTISWVIIDANEIEKLVNGYLEKLYYKYINKQLIYANDNSKFYSDIKNYLDTLMINDKLPYVFFNIKDYNSDKKSTFILKILGVRYLLKTITKYGESTHVLNEKFYQELLYIIGLKEKEVGSSKFIEIDPSVKNTLSYQVYNILKNDKEKPELEAIDKTFELIIIWMDRLLFIKLFEGQLISFNRESEEYHILDTDKISSFQDLQDLFFNVLGKPDRDDTPFYNNFKSIPYLNSSLFERYEVEKEDVNINLIKNIPVVKKQNSIVGNKNQTEINLLEYIIEFLNSYSFSSEETKDKNIVAGRDIIDSSVLGLIFEKLNGYKDGSFYTPSVITEYMCQRSIESTIIDVINKKKRWNCQDLFEIKEKIGNTIAEKKEINSIINSVKICDISVGSGHFLVSALNRIIAIKKQLGVLFKYNKNELLTEFDIDIVDDTLKVFDGQGRVFSYIKENSLLQEVQETLFNEKRVIIENCLFGVDLNSKATAICQLRLWIELLKNAYYKNGVMETLPNIDINIKSGNSLVNKLSFTVGTKIGQNSAEFEKNTAKYISSYKKLVSDYKGTSDKSIKANILKQIKSIKGTINTQWAQTSFNTDGSVNLNEDLFVYEDAFEWSIEFPELLDEKGIFQGFDCIIGNPPYGIMNKKQGKKVSILVPDRVFDYYTTKPEYKDAAGGMLNIFKLFIVRSNSLLKKDAHGCLIIPLALIGDAQHTRIRQFIMRSIQIDYIEAFPEKDNKNKRVFKDAKIPVCILGFTKKRVDGDYKFKVRIHKDKYVDENNSYLNISYNDIEVIDEEDYTIPLIKEHELPLFVKINKGCKRLKQYTECYEGECHMTNDKKYMTFSKDDVPMVKGAQVQKYYITNDVSQGEIYNINEAGYLSKHKGEKSTHHNKQRIVMQGIAGLNEKWRLKLTMIDPPCYCANSVMYLIPTSENGFNYYLLGILNSKLLNWYYTKMSTNNNINKYGVERLPIKEGTQEQREEIIGLVKELLINPDDNDKRHRIDKVVYDIYDISENEIPIIEG